MIRKRMAIKYKPLENPKSSKEKITKIQKSTLEIFLKGLDKEFLIFLLKTDRIAEDIAKINK